MAHKYGQEITIATMDTSIQISFTDPPESSADIGVHDHGQSTCTNALGTEGQPDLLSERGS